MEDSILMQKLFEMMKYGYAVMRNFPKTERYGLCADIKGCMRTMMTLIIEAQKKYYKKTTLQELDVANTELRYFVRLSHELGFLPTRQYELWSASIVEVGKIRGVKDSISVLYKRESKTGPRSGL